MESNDKEELLKFFAFAPSNIFDILKRVGFNDIGSLVNHIETYDNEG